MLKQQILRNRLMVKIFALLKPRPVAEEIPQAKGRGESLFKLHETQNRVITSIYKISISGLVAIFLILLSFTLFMLSDPLTPPWVAYLLAVVELLLIFGFFRTLKDYRSYQSHYKEISARLKELLRQQLAGKSSKGGESRLISALKPKEYGGWDSKACKQCERRIELSAEVCEHCGEDQEQFHLN